MNDPNPPYDPDYDAREIRLNDEAAEDALESANAGSREMFTRSLLGDF